MEDVFIGRGWACVIEDWAGLKGKREGTPLPHFGGLPLVTYIQIGSYPLQVSDCKSRVVARCKHSTGELHVKGDAFIMLDQL